MTGPQHSIYIAGPLGFSEAGRNFLENSLVPLVQEAGFTALNPWALTSSELIESARLLPFGDARRARWREVNAIIAGNNTEALDRADAVVAVLDGTDVDSGTAAEIGYACALGMRTIGYRSDFRLAGDNEGSLVNLQLEYFIHLRGGSIVSDLESLRKALAELKAELDN